MSLSIGGLQNGSLLIRGEVHQLSNQGGYVQDLVVLNVVVS